MAPHGRPNEAKGQLQWSRPQAPGLGADSPDEGRQGRQAGLECSRICQQYPVEEDTSHVHLHASGDELTNATRRAEALVEKVARDLDKIGASIIDGGVGLLWLIDGDANTVREFLAANGFDNAPGDSPAFTGSGMIMQEDACEPLYAGMAERSTKSLDRNFRGPRPFLKDARGNLVDYAGSAIQDAADHLLGATVRGRGVDGVMAG